MRRLVPAAATALAGVALLTACGSSSSAPAASGVAPVTRPAAASPTMDMPMPSASVDASTAATDAAAAEPVVHIKGFAFSAPSRPITAGEMFLVVNDDSASHTYEDVNHAFDSGTIKGGASVLVKAPAAGTYAVKCDFHPNMHGSLTVS